MGRGKRSGTGTIRAMPGSDTVTRIRDVGASGRTIVMVAALVGLLTVSGVVAASGGSNAGTANSIQDTNETELTSFVAESQGGYVSFSSDSEATAEEEGTAFPVLDDGQEPIQIEATVNDDGTWESENLTFPALTVTEGVEAQIEVVDGLEGEIDPEEGVFTAEGRFRVTIRGSSFTYESIQTVGESGDLSGSAEFNGDTAEVTLVDNEFTVDEETDSTTINSILGLPADEPGENWLVLNMDLTLNQEQLEDRSQPDNSEETDQQSTETLVLTVVGQAFGFAGLGAAVLVMLVTLVARIGLISLES